MPSKKCFCSVSLQASFFNWKGVRCVALDPRIMRSLLEKFGDITFLIPTKAYLRARLQLPHSGIIVWLNADSSSITAPTCCDLFTQKELPMSERLLILTQVQYQTGLRKYKLYELISAEEFPEPIHLGRARRWLESEVQLWIKQQINSPQSAFAS